MKTRTVVMLLALAFIESSAGHAFAWLKFHNDTPNTIWTTHAYASTSGFLCGFNDGCSGSDSGDFAPGWATKGWWQIAPGGTSTVQSEDYHNSYHQYYAEDGYGHVWANGGYKFCNDNEAFSWCGDICQIPRHNTPYYRWLSTSRCCGAFCSPDNYTLNFVL